MVVFSALTLCSALGLIQILPPDTGCLFGCSWILKWLVGGGGRKLFVRHKSFTEFWPIRDTEKEEGHKNQICVHGSFLSAVPDVHALRVAWLQPDSFTFNWQLTSRPNALPRSDWHRLFVQACVIRSLVCSGSHYSFIFFISALCNIVISTNFMSAWKFLFFFNLHIYAPSMRTFNKISGEVNLAGHNFFHNNLLQISTLLHSLMFSAYVGSTTDCAHKR